MSARLDHRAFKVSKAPRVQPDLRGRRVRLALLAQLDRKVTLALLVLLVPRARSVQLDQPGRKASRVTPEPRVRQARKVYKVKLGRLDLLDRKAT